LKACLDFILSIEGEGASYPTVLGNGECLCHWCHGAPGAVWLFAKAYQVLKEEKYLEGSKRAADAVWERGLLRKGNSLCHGAAGNGYSFLVLYRLTKESKYLSRARYFADWIDGDRGKSVDMKPDCPFSLFEGFSGSAVFLSDLLDPERSQLPLFDVPDLDAAASCEHLLGEVPVTYEVTTYTAADEQSFKRSTRECL